jgi:hypothetical protein
MDQDSDELLKMLENQAKCAPKNPRLSIHNKYKRRLRSLSISVADFISHAEEKLAGNVYKRAEIEHVLEKCRELAKLLPDPEDALSCPPIREDLLEVLAQSAGETEKILAEADNFFATMSKDDWEEMMRSYSEQRSKQKKAQ